MGQLLSTIWNTFLFYPFLNILLVLYAVLGDNLGFAVIVLAILVRILLLPSTRKQMDMTKKMSDMKPRLTEIQAKYKGNQEELAKAQLQLYKDVGYNPIGCLGTFLPQILILAAMIGVIRTLTEGHFEGTYDFVKSFVFGEGEMMLDTKFYIFDLAETYTDIAKTDGYLSFKGLPYLILGIVVGIVQYFATKLTQMAQPQPIKTATSKDEPMSQEEMQAQMMKSMMTIFPVMTAFITVSAPSVLGLYWLVQSMMMIIQFFFMDKERTKKVIARIRGEEIIEGEIITTLPKSEAPNVVEAEVVKKKKKRKKKKK